MSQSLDGKTAAGKTGAGDSKEEKRSGDQV